MCLTSDEYPYGWGLDTPMSNAEAMEEDHMAIKEVSCVRKQDVKEVCKPKTKPLWGVTCIHDVEDLMDHCFE